MHRTLTITCLLLLLGFSSAIAQERVYWTNVDNDKTDAEKIQRADLDGDNVQDLVTGLVWPMGIALDTDADKLYILDIRARKIQRANLDGTEVEDLVTGIGSTAVPFDDEPTETEAFRRRRSGRIALNLAAGKMYWTDRDGRTLDRANLDGSGKETLVGDGATFLGIALDVSAGKMYYSQGFPIEDDPNSNFDVVLRRANLDGSHPETLIDSSSFSANAKDIALDVSVGKMYWTHINTIHRANLDGSADETVVITPQVLEQPIEGVALDVTARKIYWTEGSIQSSNDRAIRRADLDGSNVENLVTSGLVEPRAICLDVANDKMYWVDIGVQKGAACGPGWYKCPCGVDGSQRGHIEPYGVDN